MGKPLFTPLRRLALLGSATPPDLPPLPDWIGPARGTVMHCSNGIPRAADQIVAILEALIAYLDELHKLRDLVTDRRLRAWIVVYRIHGLPRLQAAVRWWSIRAALDFGGALQEGDAAEVDRVLRDALGLRPDHATREVAGLSLLDAGREALWRALRSVRGPLWDARRPLRYLATAVRKDAERIRRDLEQRDRIEQRANTALEYFDSTGSHGRRGRDLADQFVVVSDGFRRLAVSPPRDLVDIVCHPAAPKPLKVLLEALRGEGLSEDQARYLSLREHGYSAPGALREMGRANDWSPHIALQNKLRRRLRKFAA